MLADFAVYSKTQTLIARKHFLQLLYPAYFLPKSQILIAGEMPWFAKTTTLIAAHINWSTVITGQVALSPVLWSCDKTNCLQLCHPGGTCTTLLPLLVSTHEFKLGEKEGVWEHLYKFLLDDTVRDNLFYHMIIIQEIMLLALCNTQKVIHCVDMWTELPVTGHLCWDMKTL